MAGEPPEDRIRLFPAFLVDGREIALEVEVHGAWVAGIPHTSYEPPSERSPATVKAIAQLYDAAKRHRQQQLQALEQGGQG